MIHSHIRVIKLLQKELEELEDEVLRLFNQAPKLDKEEEQEVMDIIDNLRTIP